MTAKYRELPDGTRVYRNGVHYKPVPLEKRIYKKHPPDTIWFGKQALRPLPLLPDDERPKIPFTRPDSDGATHRFGCRCRMCRTPRVQRLKRERFYSELAASRAE